MITLDFETKPVYVTKDENNKLGIIKSTACSKGCCKEYGCDFPNCAVLGIERFDTIENVQAKYPEAILI